MLGTTTILFVNFPSNFYKPVVTLYIEHIDPVPPIVSRTIETQKLYTRAHEMKSLVVTFIHKEMNDL